MRHEEGKRRARPSDRRSVERPALLPGFEHHIDRGFDRERRVVQKERVPVGISDLEKQTILNTIAQLNGDKALAARLLGIGKTTLDRKLKQYERGERQTERK